MNRTQKITLIKLAYIGLFCLSLFLLFFANLAIETVAVILYPLITVFVLMWRSIRDDYDLMIRKKLGFDVNNNLSNVKFLREVIYKDWSRKLIFYQYNLKEEGPLFVHFDIANSGNSEITLHDYLVELLYPVKKVLHSIPLFETVRVFNPIENRITEETNYLQRKKLDKGGLHTRIFQLDVPQHDYFLIRIEVNTYKCEVSHDFLFVFNNNYFSYTRCPKSYLIRKGVNYYVKNQHKIQQFLALNFPSIQ